MLQRVQSLFLLLAVACALLTWVLPVEVFTHGQDRVVFRTTGIFGADGLEIADAELPAPYHVLHTVIALVLFASIFFYGNRARQGRVVRGTWFVVIILAVMQFVSSNSLHAYLAEGGYHSTYGPAMFLPLGVILFSILAERAIRKDEELVRSADRLR